MALGISAATWAVIGTTAVTAYSAHKASSAQSDAANAARQQSDAQYQLSRQDQLGLLAQQREDQAPYRAVGTGALAQLAAGTAPGGQFAQKFDGSTFSADPGYQFRLQQGEAGINRAAAATGAGYSGATLKALARFNSGIASDEYGKAFDRFNTQNTGQFNRLASLAGIGQTATNATQQAGTTAYGNMGTWGANAANQAGGYLTNAGEARASGYASTGNAISSGIRNLYNNSSGGSGTVANTLF